MDVSIIIVNYNTSALLYNCILSIYQYTKDVDFEVIVVDNQSSDDSLDMLAREFPQVHVIISDINLGFGKANNLGAQYAIGDYLFLLNSDTLLINNAICLMFEYMVKHDNVGAVGGMLIDAGREMIHSYGYFPTASRILLPFSRKQCLCSNNLIAQVDYITGADLMIKHSIWKVLGGFDPRFFMYYEETDLQKRMKALNLKRIVLLNVNIIHLEGGSTPRNGNIVKELNVWKSYLSYLKKHCYCFFLCYMCYKYISLSVNVFFCENEKKSKMIETIKSII